MGQSFPWFVDSVLCVGVILHSLFGSRPNISHASFALPGSGGREVGLSLLYLLAGYYTFLVSMALAPYKAFYAMAAIGTICCVSRTIERRNRERGDVGSSKARKHSHKHWIGLLRKAAFLHMPFFHRRCRVHSSAPFSYGNRAEYESYGRRGEFLRSSFAAREMLRYGVFVS